MLGKHSGRHAFTDSLAKMGFRIQGDGLNQAFTRFKELADRKVEITEEDLEAIVAEELGQDLVKGSISKRSKSRVAPSACPAPGWWSAARATSSTPLPKGTA